MSVPAAFMQLSTPGPAQRPGTALASVGGFGNGGGAMGMQPNRLPGAANVASQIPASYFQSLASQQNLQNSLAGYQTPQVPQVNGVWGGNPSGSIGSSTTPFANLVTQGAAGGAALGLVNQLAKSYSPNPGTSIANAIGLGGYSATAGTGAGVLGADGAYDFSGMGAPSVAQSGVGSTLGTVAGVLGAGYGVYNAVNNWESGDTGGDTMRGAAAGAAIGSVIPVVGTIAGGVIGAGVGALSSAFGGGKQSMADKMWRTFDKSGGNVNPTSISDTDMQHIWGGGYTSNENGALKTLNAALASTYGNQKSSDGQAWNYQNFVRQTVSQAQASGTDLSSLSPAQLYSQVIQPATATAFGAQAAASVPKSFANVVGVFGSKLASTLASGKDTAYTTAKFNYTNGKG